jgi:hypothetical protein
MLLPVNRERRIWKQARQVSLEEIPEKELPLDKDGSCRVPVPPKKIVTIEFLAG